MTNLSDVSIKDLADELGRRGKPTQTGYDFGDVFVHGFGYGEEGVIVRYMPCGQMGLNKKPETVQYGIYNARIFVVIDEENHR